MTERGKAFVGKGMPTRTSILLFAYDGNVAVSIHGNLSGKEYEAAVALQPALRELMRDDRNDCRIVVGAFTPGGEVQEMDLLVLAACHQPVPIPPELLPEDLRSRPAVLTNFALAIEVKDHSPERLSFDGTHVKVLYRHRVTGRDEEKSATEQGHKQVHALREFVEKHRGKGSSPWWLSALWLRNVPAIQIPRHLESVLGSAPKAIDIMRLLVALRSDKLRKDLAKPWARSYLSCCKDEKAHELLGAIELFTRKLEPSPLERSKIEKITKRVFAKEMPEYISEIGTRLLRFRGRGGSGKTVRLLQLAHHLREERGARVLFLTYNRALAADLRRLVAIMGVREQFDQATLSIRTSQKYFAAVLRAWGMAPQAEFGDPDYGDRFEIAKRDLHNLIGKEQAGSLRKEDVWKADPSLINWDFVMIDEAQDWYDYERDTLAAIFGPGRLMVADGVDQLTRRDGRCDWLEVAPTELRKTISLTKSLRLKANLCRFIRAFADEAELEWDLEVNDEVPGGRVVLIDGPYTREQHDRVMSGHARLGNQPIDALFCVTAGGGAIGGNIAEQLKSWGANVWDGTSEDVRDTYPDDVSQFRIVKYESCRGLEGWTAVCLDFDRFSQRQFMEGRKRPSDSLYQDPDTAAKGFAARWGMIPMTRAIDTLVLQVSHDSKVGAILRDLATKHRDFVEVV